MYLHYNQDKYCYKIIDSDFLFQARTPTSSVNENEMNRALGHLCAHIG